MFIENYFDGSGKHYSMKEASKILGVSVRRLQIWGKQGKIKCVRTIGGRRVLESELKRVLGIGEADVSRRAVVYAEFFLMTKSGKGTWKDRKRVYWIMLGLKGMML